jgi:hypothetical protein
MRKLLLCTALALLVGQAAFAVPVLFLKTGTTTMEVTGSANGVSFSSFDFGGWTIAGGRGLWGEQLADYRSGTPN